MFAFHRIVQERRGMKDIFTAQPGARPHLQPELFRPSLQYPSYPYAGMLTRTAARYPEHIAVVFNDVNLTYRELEALVNAFAHALLDLGISQGQTVCLFMSNRAEYVISWFAIARIGAVASPMNPSFKEREVAYQLSNSDAVAVVVQQELLPLVEAVRAHTPALEHIITVGSGQGRRKTSPYSPGQAQDIARTGTLSGGLADQPGGLVMIHHAPTFSHLLRIHPTTPLAGTEPGWEDLVALPYSSG